MSRRRSGRRTGARGRSQYAKGAEAANGVDGGESGRWSRLARFVAALQEAIAVPANEIDWELAELSMTTRP